MLNIQYETKLTIPFCDLDPMNIVWHGNYLKYLEAARGEFFEYLGFGYEKLFAQNIAYPIVKMDLKFISPAYFNQKIIVKCILEEIEPAIIIKYEIRDEKTGAKLFKARSMQMCVDAVKRETIYKIPEFIINAVKDKNV